MEELVKGVVVVVEDDFQGRLTMVAFDSMSIFAGF